MYTLLSCFQAAIDSIRGRLMRNLLTALGIVISVASVIAVVSIVQGMSHAVLASFEGLGSSVLTIQSDTPFEAQLQGRQNRLTLNDYFFVKRKFQDAGSIIPSFAPFGPFGTLVNVGGRSTQTRLLAVTAGYQDVLHVYPSLGRFIGGSDNTSARKVCVIGEQLRKNLKLPDNPVGTFITVGGFSFEVVGLMETRGDVFGISQDDYMVIPFSAGQRVMSDARAQDVTILIDVADRSRIPSLSKDIAEALRRRHKLPKGQDDDFRVQTAQQLTASITRVTDLITLMLGGVVSISLLVGGIGIMNMMLVAVTERTREIGVCKALGARREVILLQFLLEAGIISGMGGLVGIVGGWLLSWIVALVVPSLPSPVVPLWAVTTALAFSTTVGLVFGVAPAAKAADLDPIEALRFE